MPSGLPWKSRPDQSARSAAACSETSSRRRALVANSARELVTGVQTRVESATKTPVPIGSLSGSIGLLGGVAGAT